jgi:V-type H+-transporting ATPase subunit E
VREQDFEIATKAAKEAESQYTNATGGLKTQVTVVKGNFLDKDSVGGVLVCGHEDRIKVNNTLDQRLQLVYEQKLPNLREMIFPKDSGLV